MNVSKRLDCTKPTGKTLRGKASTLDPTMTQVVLMLNCFTHYGVCSLLLLASDGSGDSFFIFNITVVVVVMRRAVTNR